jgi:predicted alpha/beta hydrolase
MDEDPRYRRAAYRGMWFAALFTLVCGALAAFSWAGVMGQQQDAPMLLLMGLGGVVLFIFTRLVIRFVRA